MSEPLLLAITRVSTVNAEGVILTNATGFFFENAEGLFLITNRHVVCYEATGHQPASLLLDLHIDPDNVAATLGFSIPLYRDSLTVWRECADSDGVVDVVAIKLDKSALPETVNYQAFKPENVILPAERIEIGTSVLIVGFPLGFYDTLHHLPVARQAIVSSEFGLRFQGNGYFLTDARLHRGTSGAPVVTRAVPANGTDADDFPWRLIGVHSARVDAVDTDLTQDDRLGLNCAWYLDALTELTAPRPVAVEKNVIPPPVAPIQPVQPAIAKT